MKEYPKEFLEKTIRVWQPHYKRRLTLEDARKITNNMVSLVHCLQDIDKSIKAKQSNQLFTMPLWYFLRTHFGYYPKPLCIVVGS